MVRKSDHVCIQEPKNIQCHQLIPDLEVSHGFVLPFALFLRVGHFS